MGKFVVLAVGIMLAGLLVATVGIAPNDAGAAQKRNDQVQKNVQGGKSSQFAGNKANMSLDESYKNRIAVKNRAAEMRKKLIRESQRQPAK